MPDWQELVRQRLSSLALDAKEKDEVQVELAAHLEESYEAFCKEGLPEKEAVHRTFEKVADWRDLQRRIFIAKRNGYPMQKRVHQLWIPGFLTMALSIVFLVTLQKLGFNPRMVSWRDSDIFFYAPWLVSLPFLGAFGAYISSRAGDFSIVATTILRDGIGWILIPGAALLVGGLLVHLLFSRRLSSQDTAIG